MDKRRIEFPTIGDHPDSSGKRGRSWVRKKVRFVVSPSSAAVGWSNGPNFLVVGRISSRIEMITLQLFSKDSSSLDDAEVLSGRWQAYVEGFVSESEDAQRQSAPPPVTA